MKKILFIDDEKEALDKLKSNLNKDFKFLPVDFSTSLDGYFEFLNRREVKLKFDKGQYAFIFIHKSLYAPKLPENKFALIKKQVGEDVLFTFSGGSFTIIEENTLSRKDLYDNFSGFIKFGIDFQEWFIPVLFYDDYIKRYAKILWTRLRNDNSLEMNNVSNNIHYKKLVKLLGLPENIVDKFSNKNIFLDKLSDKIESYG